MHLAPDPRGFPAPRLHPEQLTAHGHMLDLDLDPEIGGRGQVGGHDHDFPVHRPEHGPLEKRNPMPRQALAHHAPAFEEHGKVRSPHGDALEQTTLDLLRIEMPVEPR